MEARASAVSQVEPAYIVIPSAAEGSAVLSIGHYLPAGELPILTKGLRADSELVYPGGAPLSAVHLKAASEFGFSR